MPLFDQDVCSLASFMMEQGFLNDPIEFFEPHCETMQIQVQPLRRFYVEEGGSGHKTSFLLFQLLMVCVMRSFTAVYLIKPSFFMSSPI